MGTSFVRAHLLLLFLLASFPPNDRRFSLAFEGGLDPSSIEPASPLSDWRDDTVRRSDVCHRIAFESGKFTRPCEDAAPFPLSVVLVTNDGLDRGSLLLVI